MKKLILIILILGTVLSSYSQQKGTFKDPRDGKIYKTLAIGTQTWFTENLAYKTDSACWAYNNNTSNIAKFGYLYGWETAKKVCPMGWHLPSDLEWTILVKYLGGDRLAVEKLKALTDWKLNDDGKANNASGFSALPAGSLSNAVTFKGIGETAHFWSSTPVEKDYAWTRLLYFDDNVVYRYSFVHSTGCSVRCLKN